MNQRAWLCWLLYLYPRDFRERFGEEIHEYLTKRRLEVEPPRRLSQVLFTAHIALELASGALQERARGLSAAKVGLRCTAVTAGVTLATIWLGAPFVAYENLIRVPLLRIYKSGDDAVAAAILVGALILAIVALFAIYCYAQSGGTRMPRRTVDEGLRL